jgi:hypothetical protein
MGYIETQNGAKTGFDTTFGLLYQRFCSPYLKLSGG